MIMPAHRTIRRFQRLAHALAERSWLVRLPTQAAAQLESSLTVLHQ